MVRKMDASLVFEMEVQRNVLEKALNHPDLAVKQSDNLKYELEKAKTELEKIKAEKLAIEALNYKLENDLVVITKKVRLDELKVNNNALEGVELKLLRLKLNALENDKRFLMENIEKERKLMENQSKPRIARFEKNMKLMRKWLENEAKERWPQDSNEVKALKRQIASLEADKLNLIEGFDLERKVFRRILKNNGTV